MVFRFFSTEHAVIEFQNKTIECLKTKNMLL